MSKRQKQKYLFQKQYERAQQTDFFLIICLLSFYKAMSFTENRIIM